MKKHIYNTLFLLLLGISVWGQSPNWVVNENDYEHTMSFVAFLNVNGNDLNSTNDKVAAFVNGVCRGVAHLTYSSDKDAYYAYLTVLANQSGETITFKMYHEANDEVVDAVQTENFEIDQHHGNLFQAYSIASPALQTGTEISSFGFSNVATITSVVTQHQIQLVVDQNADITSLIPTFELSQGATLFNGVEVLTDEQNTLDFSNPLVLKVRSEDQSTVKEWTISVTQSSGNVVYYKKDAVCYNEGMIKVIFNSDNTEVSLHKNGEFYATQVIQDGETLFQDLGIGVYTVTVSGNSKEITIAQKE